MSCLPKIQNDEISPFKILFRYDFIAEITGIIIWVFKR
jgi:hypothetical protein